MNAGKHEVYLETGKKKVFACALQWPGWCRAGRDEDSALQALFAYGSRYATVLEGHGLEFFVAEEPGGFHVSERVTGNFTTDYGSPDIVIARDAGRIAPAELERFETVLKAAWQALDRAAQLARGRLLRKGPRGGGRDQEGILAHVLGAEAAYLSRLGWKVKRIKDEPLDKMLVRIRAEALKGLRAAAAGQLAETGPRGSKRWPARFYVRRSAWHVLDHAWEIEDRIER